MTILNKAHHVSDNDLDGVSCLYLSKVKFAKKNLTAIASTTRSIDDMVREFVVNEWEKDTLLIITDLSIDSKELADLIDEKVKDGYQAILLDHHETAEWLNEYSWANVIMVKDGENTSATSLYLDYLTKEQNFTYTRKMATYVEWVRAYDTWDWFHSGNRKPKEMNDLLYLIGEYKFQEYVMDQFSNLHHHIPFGLSEQHEFLLMVEQERISRYIADKKKQVKFELLTIEGRQYTVALVTAESYTSELGNAICRDFKEVDFVAMTNVGLNKISFRASRDGVDVGVVAKSIDGGGGRTQTAGCPLNEQSAPLFLFPLLKGIIS